MELVRRIGRHDVLVETDEPCGISLEADTLTIPNAQTSVSLSKKAVLNSLASGDEYVPLSLQWELLDKCNFSCPFCYIVGHSAHRVVRFADIRHHLVDLISAGLLFCTLTGGEVTVHPDFKEIYTLLKKGGVVVEVFSNGLLFDEETIDLFVRLPPSSVEISLYTLSDERLHRFYRVSDQSGASRVLANVLKLKAAGINVVCKTFLNTTTAQDIEAIVDWCALNNIPHYSSDTVTNAYDGASLEAFRVAATERTKYLPQNPVCLPCRTKNYGSAIDSSFSIYPCPAIHLADCTYDIRKYGVPESLRRMKDFMRKFQDSVIQKTSNSSKCASCIAFANPVRDKNGEISHFAHP